MDLAQLETIAETEISSRPPNRLHCCMGTGCRAAGSAEVKLAAEHAVAEAGLASSVRVVGVGCPGWCSHGPLLEVVPSGPLYQRVRPSQCRGIVAALQGGVCDAVALDRSHPFLTRQFKIVRAIADRIDPERIEDYIAEGGYRALEQAVHTAPAEVVTTVMKSGLRGRGGAGYPTGLKWATVAKMPDQQKYVICNGDEGDPGAFMDRAVMEDTPHQFWKGWRLPAMQWEPTKVSFMFERNTPWQSSGFAKQSRKLINWVYLVRVSLALPSSFMLKSASERVLMCVARRPL